MRKDDFEQVYARYYKAVYAYLMTLCHDSELAADLAQETFYKALRGIDSFQGGMPGECVAVQHRQARAGGPLPPP